MVAFAGVVTTGVVVGQGSVSEAAPTPAVRSVVVQPGQTLWGIAVEQAPDVDPRLTVQRLVAVNGLTSPDAITAGDLLDIPAAG